MGLISWLFPSDEDRIRSARTMLERGHHADARLEVLEIDHDDARAVLGQAEQALALKNLQTAISWAEAGDDHRVASHLELAENFHHGGLEDEFRDGRRRLRELRAARSEEAARAKQQKAARQMAADPLGLTGGANWLDKPPPGDLYDPRLDELEARVALIIEGYPDGLRQTVAQLGADFAKAVIDLDDNRADRALQALLALPDDQPLVRWERARACHALNDPKAAAAEIRAFAELAGGHHDMGRSHSGELLALVTVEAGDPHGALRVLRSVRATDPKRGTMLFAQLLEATGDLGEAEKVLTGLIGQHPRTQSLYSMLCRVRLRGGHRAEAMRALEASLEAVCCTPGKCGSQPPNLDILRSLSTLYLEDGVERERALELADQAFGLVEKPLWEDIYLRALVARVTQDPEATDFATRLRTLTPAGDPRAARLEAHLA